MIRVLYDILWALVMTGLFIIAMMIGFETEKYLELHRPWYMYREDRTVWCMDTTPTIGRDNQHHLNA